MKNLKAVLNAIQLLFQEMTIHPVKTEATYASLNRAAWMADEGVRNLEIGQTARAAYCCGFALRALIGAGVFKASNLTDLQKMMEE